jgi:hypothetical protein
MATIKEIQLPSGKTFFIEVKETDLHSSKTTHETQQFAPMMPEGAEATGIGEHVEALTEKVEAVTEPITAALEYVHQAFDDHVHAPDELTIEFCIGLRGKAALPVILSGETEAAFKVTARWENKK